MHITLSPSLKKFSLHSMYSRNYSFLDILRSIIKPNLSFSYIIILKYFLPFSYAYIDLSSFLHLNWSNWNWNWGKHFIFSNQQILYTFQICFYYFGGTMWAILTNSDWVW